MGEERRQQQARVSLLSLFRVACCLVVFAGSRLLSSLDRHALLVHLFYLPLPLYLVILNPASKGNFPKNSVLPWEDNFLPKLVKFVAPLDFSIDR